MHHFNRAGLRSNLAPLSVRARVAFAAACAARLRPYFGYPEPFSPPPPLVATYEAFRRYLQDSGPTIPACTELEAALAAVDLDDDAVAAAIFALRSLNPEDGEAAAWAAERAYNARDRQAGDALEFTFYTPAVEQTLIASRPVQAELGRQAADLAALAADPSACAQVWTSAWLAGNAMDAV